MKVVILAGGRGTRIGEESEVIPKPMIEIGGKPIIWHIMKLYSYYGFNEFIVCLGYKGYVFKEFFSHYFLHTHDVTIDISTNEIEIHSHSDERWKITLVDTGSHTMTGGRIKRILPYIDSTFMMTYGDGISDVNIEKLLAFHRMNGKLATVTAVKQSGRFGNLEIAKRGRVRAFHEKPEAEAWVNGGFFVLEPPVVDYIDEDRTLWEGRPLEILAKNKQLVAYKHQGFWKPMDTLREKKELECLWATKAPWKLWK